MGENLDSYLCKTKKRKNGLPEYLEEFERVASSQVRIGETLCSGGIHSLLREFFAEDSCCFVRLVFEPQCLPSKVEGESWEQ